MKPKNKINLFSIFLLMLFIFSTNIFVSSIEINGGVSYESGVTCNPGSFTCEDDDLYICNGEGNDILKYKDCQLNCEFFSGSARCGEDKKLEDKINILFYIIPALFSIFIIFVFLIKLIKKKNANKK